MKRLLITGMSGTGKSTIFQMLKNLGYRAIDMDYEDWSEYRSDGEWVWREEKLSNYLNQKSDENLFIAGCAINQVKFYSKFDYIILLSAPKTIIIERLKNRTNNPYGQRRDELEEIFYNLETIEPQLRKRATHEIITVISVDQVLQKILNLV